MAISAYITAIEQNTQKELNVEELSKEIAEKLYAAKKFSSLMTAKGA